jgi:hypothetical protein
MFLAATTETKCECDKNVHSLSLCFIETNHQHANKEIHHNSHVGTPSPRKKRNNSTPTRKTTNAEKKQILQQLISPKNNKVSWIFLFLTVSSILKLIFQFKLIKKLR